MKIEKYQARIDVKDYVEEYVNVEEFEEFCKACENYGKKWSCPPFKFDPLDYWNNYDRLYLIGMKIYMDEEEQKNCRENIAKVKNEMSNFLFEMELEYVGGVSLCAGSCEICGVEYENCTRSVNQPCRHPEHMRYSIEALGGNVGLTASKLLGLELQWIEDGKMPEYFVLVGGLLYSNKCFM
ncbi:MAG: DUF2284 domain-containing protein [Peptostreptococcaceae bacterium]|nr:DUF2284 domain-containing protein [Peptostreptococcaceae bacterium]MDY5739311.1 DUF2284 domain-containing protein [Anaerovoracaceae bacterium]